MSKFDLYIYWRISNLINLKVSDGNNTSQNSKTVQTITENSIISNIDTWVGNLSQEDSKQFEKKFTEIKIHKINDGTFPKLKKNKIKAKSLLDGNNIKNNNSTKNKNDSTKKVNGFLKSGSNILLPKQQSKDTLKFNLNSNIYVPSKISQAKAFYSNKPKNLLLNMNNEEPVDDRNDNKSKSPTEVINFNNYSRSFVNIENKIINNPFITNVIQEEEKDKATGLNNTESLQFYPNTTKNTPLFSHNYNESYGYNKYNANLNNYASNYSGTTFSCTPKHQKFISDHAINIKHSSNANGSEEKSIHEFYQESQGKWRIININNSFNTN